VRLLLKRTARTADIRRMEHDDARADTPTDLPDVQADVQAAFGSAPARAPWWADSRLRLGLLFAGLAVAVLALLTAKTELFNRGSGSSQARGTLFAPGCPGQDAPAAESIPGADIAALRNAVSRIMPPRVGRVYEAGTITTSNLWSDDSPQQLPSSGSQAGSVPAGYEMRWWALDREGNEDDVVADVLEFSTERQAQNALLQASSPRCRSDGAAHAGRFPSGADNLYWVNPDNAQQWDVLFARGRRLYRVDDVPSDYPPATGPAQRTLEQHRANSTVEALACALPGAGCQASAVSARATNLATLTASSPSHPGAPRPITRAQAGTYAHAVNLRGYDVPGMTQVVSEGPTEDRGYWETFARCTGEPRPMHAVVTIHSPIFAYSNRLRFQSAYSTVAVLPSEAAAGQYLAVLAGARGRACITHSDGRSLLRHAAESKPLRLGQITVAPLPASAPTSYRGLGPYRATALRLTIQSSYTTRRGRLVQFPFYFEDFVFACGRDLINLTTESSLSPFPPASEQYLMKMLVGRAEANEA
jgi:hypothetical protein